MDTQIVAPTPEYVPLAHCVHCVAPVVAEYVFAGQDAYPVAPDAELAKEPAGTTEQVVEPAAEEYEPATQGEMPDDPGNPPLLGKDPAGVTRHTLQPAVEV